MLLLLEIVPYIVIFIFGITIGSFLNVCIYRIPLHQSIVTVSSHCMTCGRKLKWYDMVPVFSWLLLGGKCRSCKSKISLQYPVIELLNGILYVVICLVNGMDLFSLIYCLMTSALLTLSLIDWRTYEIPPGINGFLFILGVAAAVLDRGNLLSHLAGMVCVSGFLGILYLISRGRAIGGGDIKLMFACGLILGWKQIILAFLLGCIIGSVIHLIRIRVQGEGHVLAMGPYLSAGIFLAALWGNAWISWYISLL
ncbi:prepilin peptidase [Blautia massiliensis]|jgi:leader peptidase (prepilin peptidase) / N-methyltransferase|uniref:prepilin peptidase n=1 Tax=Blautia TaxID=572511 RepID=UPI00156F261E|nr:MULTISPECIES: A24 family peptidase [Blautia]MCC2724761.1 prepilin peptidase [Blautia sp. MSK22_86]NSF57986.1 prepilin peptidase [Blautia massiliensis (ex Durand et al. 2017)]NSK73404.1 prepilin peptidase [Blautia massiliensis (ex Durand et al. 2017)]